MGPSMIVDGDVLAPPPAEFPEPRFNGAVDDRRRRPPFPRSRGTLHHASMGPSMIVDGDSSTSARRASPTTGFNGAVDDRRRRRDPVVIEYDGQEPLQWGRR